MQITYGHPATGGPTRFITYAREEVLKHLVQSSNEQKEQQARIVAEAKYQMRIVADGLLPAAVFTAALLRENNIPLASTCYNKEDKILTICYDDPRYKQSFIAYATELFKYPSLLDLKTDKWGNNLFSNGKAIV